MPFWCQLICSYYSFLVIRNLQYCHSYHCYHDDDDNDDFDHPSFSLSSSFCCKKHWAGIRSSYIIQTDHKIPLNWKMDICHIWNFAYLSWRVKLFVTFFSLLNHKFLSLFVCTILINIVECTYIHGEVDQVYLSHLVGNVWGCVTWRLFSIGLEYLLWWKLTITIHKKWTFILAAFDND